MKKIMSKTLVAVLVSVLLLGAGVAVGYTLFKDVLYQYVIVDEAESVEIYTNAGCTVIATGEDLGDIERGGQYIEYLYAKNESETRTTLLRAELINPYGWMVVPTSVTLAPGESVQFQIGVVVPYDAQLGADSFTVRFYEDADAPPPAGFPINIPGTDARFEW